MQVPLLDLRAQYASLKDEIIAEISEICDSQRFILGPKVEKLESEIAAYCRSTGAVGVTSGSDALIISLMVEGIKAGDEVITTPFTFFATVGAIVRVGATPVFADIDPVTFNIDPKKIEEKITPRTKAIIPVHLFGQAADMDPIMEIARKHNLVVIEDACQAIGAEYKGRRVGSIGNYGAFSFFPSKNLGCFGDGGMVTCNDPEKVKLLKIFRNHGQSGTYMHDYVGGNFRLDAIQAAGLLVKLPHLDTWGQMRRSNASIYNEAFESVEEIKTPYIQPQNYSIFNQYIVAVDHRDDVIAYLRSKDIGCEIYYPVPLHMQECFAQLGYKEGDFPNAEYAAKHTIALPIYPELTLDQLNYVIETLKEAWSICPLCGASQGFVQLKLN